LPGTRSANTRSTLIVIHRRDRTERHVSSNFTSSATLAISSVGMSSTIPKREVSRCALLRHRKGKELSMIWQVEQLEREVANWPGVTAHSHQFAGREFRFGDAEIGHVHVGGVVDIPFPRAVRDALLAKGLAEEHHWVPDSGWTTFRIRRQDQMAHAIWLMRL